MVYQEGDKMKVQANAASRAMIEVSVLEVKTTTIMYVLATVPKDITEKLEEIINKNIPIKLIMI